MLAVSTSAATQELAGFCSSIWSRPRSALKRPLVVLTGITRTENDTREWMGSISQIIEILLEQIFRMSCSAGVSLPSLRQPVQPLTWPPPIEIWNAHSERTNGNLCKERGSRGHVCDRLLTCL